MSTAEIVPPMPLERTRFHTAKPSFIGLVRGELFKLRQQWATWIMLIIMIALTLFPYVITFSLQSTANGLNDDPADFLGQWLGLNLMLLRVVGGFILIIMTARMIGQEYNLGTIRILLARGVGRVQLLVAKLTSLAIWAIFLMLISIALNSLLTLALVQIKTGSLDAISAITSPIWHDLGVYVGVVALSMGVSILLAAAFSVLGRSLVFGMSLSLIWFPLDNIMVGVLALISQLTGNTAWRDSTAYLLGPNINTMLTAVTGQEWAFGATVLPPVDGTHTVVVTLVYAAVFAVIAFWLTWKRDVKE